MSGMLCVQKCGLREAEEEEEEEGKVLSMYRDDTDRSLSRSVRLLSSFLPIPRRGESCAVTDSQWEVDG